MSFGNILEQILREGMTGQSRARLELSVGPEGLGGVPGLDELLGTVLGGQARGRSTGGGVGDMSRGGASGSASSGGLEDLRGAMGLTGAAANVAPDEIETMTGPETEQLMLRAMISADGAVDESEIPRIVGKIDDDGVSPTEKHFLRTELRKPLDLRSLVEAVPSRAVAAQVYSASLLAMDIDTEAEVAYLRRLATELDLDAATVARLHELTGAPGV
jgi:uncharacterized membrane protein YebE (DUF533 family)